MTLSCRDSGIKPKARPELSYLETGRLHLDTALPRNQAILSRMSIHEPPEGQGPTDKIFLPSVILLSIASYNVAEVLVWILSIFRHFHGLYFYSCLVTNLSLGGFIGLADYSLYTSGSAASWSHVLRALVCGTLSTAQILILYARLHLVCPHSPRVVRAIRLAIIVTSSLLLPPQFICYIYASRKPSWAATNTIIQRGILITFTVREIAVCVVYIV
ncbi:hypothetical protein BJX65DRAFT_303964 [Aspergillus insuetus]